MQPQLAARNDPLRTTLGVAILVAAALIAGASGGYTVATAAGAGRQGTESPRSLTLSTARSAHDDWATSGTTDRPASLIPEATELVPLNYP